jgi:hypothetical protein
MLSTSVILALMKCIIHLVTELPPSRRARYFLYRAVADMCGVRDLTPVSWSLDIEKEIESFEDSTELEVRGDRAQGRWGDLHLVYLRVAPTADTQVLLGQLDCLRQEGLQPISIHTCEMQLRGIMREAVSSLFEGKALCKTVDVLHRIPCPRPSSFLN